MNNKRIVITGMSVNTPIGDTLDGFIDNLLKGTSAITSWRSLKTDNIYSKVGGDLGQYDVQHKIDTLADKIPPACLERLRKLTSKFSLATAMSMVSAVEAFQDAGLFEYVNEDNNVSTVVAAHNQNQNYVFQNHEIFNDEPDFIDGLFALSGLDTNHVGTVTEVLQLKGPAYTVGAACASGNAALKAGFDEIQQYDVPVSVVVGPMLEFSPLDLQGMAIMGAISIDTFDKEPHTASRPYDANRNGFVPSHGVATVILEDLEHAKARGADIYAEVLGALASCDGNHLPQPSRAGQVKIMNGLLNRCRVKPTDIDFISAHATSTPLGDLTELRSIKDVFGAHAYKLKINAPKSMLGHTCWSSALVELVAGVLQMRKGDIHPSINIDQLDAEVDLDICRGEKQTHPIRYMMNNSFGFGGLNSISLIKQFEG